MASIAIVIGSKTDETFIKPAIDTLNEMKVAYDFSIISAHRNPDKLREFAISASEKGIEVIIAAAGAAAHLPGAIASWNKGAIPVIGVPLPTSDLKGIDSLYSIVQMPSGVPVACVGIGSSGAKNAALLSVQILALKYPEVKRAYDTYKSKLQQV